VRRAVAGLLTSALLLAGCSTVTHGGGEPQSGAWSLPEAQQHYLDYVAAGNQAIAVVNRLICTCSAQLDPQMLADACQAVADDNATLALRLDTGAWPENARSAIYSLASAVTVQSKGYRSCAAASTLSSMRAQERTAVSTEKQADEVRRVLQLPPVGPAEMAPRPTATSATVG
jgi:hypothetical protein